jgi:hypothetical protein
MKLNDLTKNIRENLRQKLKIKNTLSILNVPKQALLEKGNLVILLDDKNKPLSFSWAKDDKFHVELLSKFPEELVESIFKSKATRIFETEEDFDADIDMDYKVDYSDLEAILKKQLRELIKSGEKQLEEANTKFGKLDKNSLIKSLKTQSGSFNIWMTENGFEKPNVKCLKEAFKEADLKNDFPLKKRASFAKCFYKIANNGK